MKAALGHLRKHPVADPRPVDHDPRNPLGLSQPAISASLKSDRHPPPQTRRPAPIDPVYAIPQEAPSGHTVSDDCIEEEGGRKQYDLAEQVSFRHVGSYKRRAIGCRVQSTKNSSPVEYATLPDRRSNDSVMRSAAFFPASPPSFCVPDSIFASLPPAFSVILTTINRPAPSIWPQTKTGRLATAA